MSPDERENGVYGFSCSDAHASYRSANRRVVEGRIASRAMRGIVTDALELRVSTNVDLQDAALLWLRRGRAGCGSEDGGVEVSTIRNDNRSFVRTVDCISYIEPQSLVEVIEERTSDRNDEFGIAHAIVARYSTTLRFGQLRIRSKYDLEEFEPQEVIFGGRSRGAALGDSENTAENEIQESTLSVTVRSHVPA